MKTRRDFLKTMGVFGLGANMPIHSFAFSNNDDKAKNSIGGNVANIYYETDKFSLTREDKFDIDIYMNKLMNSDLSDFENLIIYGMADLRGNKEYNYDLGMSRAVNGADYLISNYPGLAGKISVESLGEVICNKELFSFSPEDLKRYRKITLTPKRNSLEYALKILESNPQEEKFLIYLIDISGSTKYNRAMNYIRNVHNYKKNSKKFVFSQVSGRKNVFSVEDVSSLKEHEITGTTSYFLSSCNLFENIENPTGMPAQIISVVNGEDNVGGRTLEELIVLANKKNLQLDFITIDTEKEFKEKLKLASLSTNGTLIDLYTPLED